MFCNNVPTVNGDKLLSEFNIINFSALPQWIFRHFRLYPQFRGNAEKSQFLIFSAPASRRNKISENCLVCLKDNCPGFQQRSSEIMPGVSLSIFFMSKLKSSGVAPTSPKVWLQRHLIFNFSSGYLTIMWVVFSEFIMEMWAEEGATTCAEISDFSIKAHILMINSENTTHIICWAIKTIRDLSVLTFAPPPPHHHHTIAGREQTAPCSFEWISHADTETENSGLVDSVAGARSEADVHCKRHVTALFI